MLSGLEIPHEDPLLFVNRRILSSSLHFPATTSYLQHQPKSPESNIPLIAIGIWTMAQAKVLTESELKRALAVVLGRRHAQRDKLALLLTHWAGMRVCEVAALTRDKVLGPAGEMLEEWRLTSDQSKGGICA